MYRCTVHRYIDAAQESPRPFPLPVGEGVAHPIGRAKITTSYQTAGARSAGGANHGGLGKIIAPMGGAGNAQDRWLGIGEGSGKADRGGLRMSPLGDISARRKFPIAGVKLGKEKGGLVYSAVSRFRR